MSKKRLNWLTRAASILIVSMLLIPMFFGGVRNVQAANITVCASGCDYTTIQEAVTNAPDGSTVEVKAGTYVEQVKITKNLTLFTAEDAVINPPATILSACSTVLTNYPLICVEPPNPASSVNVTVDGFTINGMDRAAAGTIDRYFGITYHNAGGIIQNNVITGIKGSINSNLYRADGIYVTENDKTIALDIKILGNTISDFHKNAITLTTQTWPTPLSFLIQLNVVTGTPNATVAQNGIQVNAPNSGGIIQENIISNIAYNNAPTDPDPDKAPLVAVGILNISTPADTVLNDITNSQVGILYFSDDNDIGNPREISGNLIQVIKPGTVNNPGRNVYGILVTDRSKDILSPVDPLTLNAVDAVLMGVSLSVAVKNNTISYVGTLPNTNTFGIEVDAGVGTSTVLGDNVLSMDIAQNRVGGVGIGFDVGLLLYQCDPENLPVGIDACGSGILDTSRIVSNDITGNNYGVYVDGPIGQSRLDDFHHNRIAGNVVGLQNETGLEIGLPNNWWGCNDGPGAAGCDTLVGNLTGLADPWLVLSTVATPTTVQVGGTSTLTADLKWNSNAENTALSGFYVRDGIPVTFSVATLGSVFPLNVGTLSGAAPTTFTAPFVGGTFQVCATVDSETVCSDVTVEPPLMIFLPIVSR